jgi:hypothetical protein
MTALAKAEADLQQPGKMADFTISTQPAKGVTRLRFVVRETETGRMGTVDISVAD